MKNQVSEAQKITSEIIAKYGEMPCCEIQDSEFSAGGLFDLLANIDGHASGKAMMNDCSIRWQKSAKSVAQDLLESIEDRGE